MLRACALTRTAIGCRKTPQSHTKTIHLQPEPPTPGVSTTTHKLGGKTLPLYHENGKSVPPNLTRLAAWLPFCPSGNGREPCLDNLLWV